MSRAFPRLFAAAILFTTAITHPQGAKVSSPLELAHRADQLKPGQWVWAPAIAPKGPVLIYVDLSRQIATVYRNGVRIGVSTISSGKDGYATPTGVFTILQKDRNHHSNVYNNAPMYFQLRLTWGGVALHAGGLPGYPESHGCIHLPYAFSKLLFGITSLGGTVVVEGNAADRIATLPATVVVPMSLPGQKTGDTPLTSGEFRWQPELSPTGPLSIVISKTDQRMVVLRNGIEIGRSVVEVDAIDDNPRVVTLAAGPDGRPQWVYVDLPGDESTAGKVVDENTIKRVHMPRDFYAALQPLLQIGTTVDVTMSHIDATTTGEKLTIIDSVTAQ
ncbi:MAG TPA: L,D-transpeptidase family protein [Edaphobacter sp.]